MVSAGSYLLSAILLAAVGSSVGFAAFRIRRHLLPAWDGAPARLVELVLAVALLIWLCELLGLFGLLYASTLAIEALLLAAAILAWPIGAAARGSAGGEGASAVELAPAPAAPRGMTLVALAVVFVVFAHWGLYAKYVLDHGISNFDSLWYHMPFAADIAQSHSVTGLHYTDTSYVGWFYTQNSELLNAAGITLTGRDTLSLFLNFGWLALAFLAAWCIGRPYGRAPLTVVAAAILLECNTLIARAPGAAKNDTMTIAFALAALAIVLNAWVAQRREQADRTASRPTLRPGWALAAAGLAAGLAFGTRITVLPLVFALTVAVVALAPTGRRWAASAWWLGPAFATSGFWLLRNLVDAGNPLPQVTHLGPISLPHPERLQPVSNEATVLHYATDTHVWSRYFGPGLHEAFGVLWPLVVGGSLAGAVLALIRGRDRALRWAGAVALVGLLGYLVTPLGAGGTAGAPFNFWINVRYALPAMLAGLVLLPLARGLEGAARQWALLAALVVVLWVTDGADAVLHDPDRAFGLLLAVVAVAAPAAIVWAGRRGLSNREVAAGFAILALLIALIGYPLQRHYLRGRFALGSGLPGYGLESAYAWARDLHDVRIGLAGSTAAFNQYGFYGTDLSNRVIYLGEEGVHGAFNPIPDCSAFRRAVDAADLDYLVTSPFLNFVDSAEPIASPEAGWLRGSPAVEAVSEEGPVTVWRVAGSLDPSGCGPENAPLHSVPQQPGA